MTTLRSIVEQLTHRLVIKRRLPPTFGSVPFFVSTEGGLRFLRLNLAKVDPDLLRMAEELVEPGQVVWDIGANLGLFTFAAAARAGPSGSVYAIEPDTYLINLLRRSAGLEQVKRAPVNAIPVAASDTVGVSRFCIAKRARSANHLDFCGSLQTGGTRETQWVVTVTLDWMLERFPVPNVLKVDVEGAEARVLSAATKVLSSCRPRILCEVFDECAVEVSKILQSFDYALFDAASHPSKRQPISRAAYTTLAYPCERLGART